MRYRWLMMLLALLVLIVGPVLPDPKVVTVTVKVTDHGFEPARMDFPANKPIRLLVTRTTDKTCATALESKALGIPKTPLPLNKQVSFDLAPRPAGSYAFSCPMNMIKGTIIVR